MYHATKIVYDEVYTTTTRATVGGRLQAGMTIGAATTPPTWNDNRNDNRHNNRHDYRNNYQNEYRNDNDRNRNPGNARNWEVTRRWDHGDKNTASAAVVLLGRDNSNVKAATTW